MYLIQSTKKYTSSRVIECDRLVKEITNAYECENSDDLPSNQICDQAAQQFFNDLLFTCNQRKLLNNFKAKAYGLIQESDFEGAECSGEFLFFR